MFLSWPWADQDAALALHKREQDEQAEKDQYECPVCGGDSRECQNPDYQRAYEASFSRCYRTKAVGKAMAKRADDKDSKALVAMTRFHPERVKTKN